jgi:hypothetical protein
MFKTGTKMYWKSTNKPAYEKLNDKDFGTWVSLDSTYVVREMVNDEMVDVVHPETEKPLYRNDGTLNRFGFRLTDQQVHDYYNGFMNFV